MVYKSLNDCPILCWSFLVFVILVPSNCPEVEVETVTTSGGVTEEEKEEEEEERRGKRKERKKKEEEEEERRGRSVSTVDRLHTCNDGATFQVLSCGYLPVSLRSKTVHALSSLHRTYN